ncbi:MAG: hypothetical protein O4965_04425 [Trichodesmium sp. St19_bin1]|nr:hypothetical protein [Trichodesmium sp. St19_bin1]
MDYYILEFSLNRWKKSLKLQHFSYRSTTIGTLHARSLQGFGYGDVVHQFKKRGKTQQ